MPLTTDLHPWFSYDWWTDIGTPALSGIGGILVGVGAIVVAARSHALSRRVRDDERKRDEEAARVRYREELFRTVEAAVSALLDHAIELETELVTGSRNKIRSVADVMSRLHVVSVVANAEDEAFVEATLQAYGRALRKGLQERAELITTLGLGLVTLLAEERDVAGLVRKANAIAQDEND